MALKIEIVGLDWEIIITVYVLVLGKLGFLCWCLIALMHLLVPRIVDFIAKLWNNLAVLLEGVFVKDCAFYRKRLSINN